MQSEIASGRDASIGLAEVTDRRAVTSRDVLRVIRRAIIRDDDFHLFVGLSEYALDCATEHVSPIERRNNDAHEARYSRALSDVESLVHAMAHCKQDAYRLRALSLIRGVASA